MNEVILKCESVSKIFTDVAQPLEILTDINLTVHSGEFVSIIGSSGSGKSTLLHLLGGLDVPNKGKIYFRNQLLQQLSEKEKCYLRNHYMGFIYQFHHLLPEFTALENIAMPLLIAGLDIKTIQEKSEQILSQVGLSARSKHKVAQLSGGERQRVAIARALVVNPLCILADEPTGNLDPHNADKILELFFNLQSEYKTSVVLVTHDHNIALKAKRVYKIENGSLIDAQC